MVSTRDATSYDCCVRADAVDIHVDRCDGPRVPRPVGIVPARFVGGLEVDRAPWPRRCHEHRIGQSDGLISRCREATRGPEL